MRFYYSFIFVFILSTTYAQQPSRPSSPNQPQVTTSPVTSTTSSVSETLRYVNNLFDLYNKYNSSVNVDLVTNEMVFSDKFSELRGNFSEVEFRRKGENMGIFCKNGSNCLRSRDTNTGDAESPRSQYTFGIKRNGTAVAETDVAIQKLNNILRQLSSGSPSISSNSAAIQNQLDIINSAFRQYNNYDTVFSVKGGRLHWDSRVANVSGDMKDLTFYINYDNKWMVVQCISGDCLEGGVSKDSYSMGLSTSSGAIAPNIEEVLSAFNKLRREVLTR